MGVLRTTAQILCSFTMNDETKWLIGYLLSSWLSNFGHGMVVTVIGPSQPYLAFNVGVSIGNLIMKSWYSRALLYKASLSTDFADTRFFN